MNLRQHNIPAPPFPVLSTLVIVGLATLSPLSVSTVRTSYQPTSPTTWDKTNNDFAGDVALAWDQGERYASDIGIDINTLVAKAAGSLREAGVLSEIAPRPSQIQLSEEQLEAWIDEHESGGLS